MQQFGRRQSTRCRKPQLPIQSKSDQSLSPGDGSPVCITVISSGVMTRWFSPRLQKQRGDSLVRVGGTQVTGELDIHVADGPLQQGP